MSSSAERVRIQPALAASVRVSAGRLAGVAGLLGVPESLVEEAAGFETVDLDSRDP